MAGETSQHLGVVRCGSWQQQLGWQSFLVLCVAELIFLLCGTWNSQRKLGGIALQGRLVALVSYSRI